MFDLTISVDNEPFLYFDSADTLKLLDWFEKCDPNLAYPVDCPLSLLGKEDCWYVTMFSNMINACYNHNYEIDYLSLNNLHISLVHYSQLVTWIFSIDRTFGGE